MHQLVCGRAGQDHTIPVWQLRWWYSKLPRIMRPRLRREMVEDGDEVFPAPQKQAQPPIAELGLTAGGKLNSGGQPLLQGQGPEASPFLPTAKKKMASLSFINIQ
ncbi:hypothetical protein HRR80_001672 [Exophiala dermatitidis]|uniref:Uncharacterized protein n=1 Tax=Exophiala dermatitidis TaxID=5970 RepID=A0AAN6IYP6_EXODE|nr:hypothetical protein HRR80_001672 [Exophiala dermatitidis]